MKIPAKQRILETADTLFSARGYGNVGINEIIARSETAKASFYNHFPSKLELCAAWLEERHTRSAREWEKTLAAPGSLAVKVSRLFDALAAFLEASAFRGCPFTNTAGFLGAEAEAAPVRVLIAQHKTTHRAFFVALAARETTPARARKLGSALFLLYSGATIESQNAGALWPVEAAREGSRWLLQSVA